MTTQHPLSAPKLTAFQNTFGDYLRRQTHTELDIPPARTGKLYQSLIWNNLTTFVNQCFPVCKAITDAQTWQELLQDFLQQGNMHSPYFSEINEQFVDYLQHHDVITRFDLPKFFVELAHYEWAELYVDNLPDSKPTAFVSYQNQVLALNPSVQVLHYTWAVQTVSPSHQPDSPSDTFLLVYRKLVNHKYQTAFMNVNVLSFFLLQFIKDHIEHNQTPYQDVQTLCNQFTQQFNLPNETLLTAIDDLFTTMIDHQVFLKK